MITETQACIIVLQLTDELLAQLQPFMAGLDIAATAHGEGAVKGSRTLARPRAAVYGIRTALMWMVKALALREVACSALASGRLPSCMTPWHAMARRFAASGSHPFVK